MDFDVLDLGRKRTITFEAFSLHGEVDLARSQIKEGEMDVNLIESHSGMSAIHQSIKYGNKEMIQMLLEEGGDANLCTSKGESPLSIASENGVLDIVNILLEASADPQSCNAKGDSPLMIALKNHRFHLMDALLPKSDVNHINHDGESALAIVCSSGNVDAFNMLVEAGGDITFTTSLENQNLLMISCVAGNLPICKRLVELDSLFINQIDENGDTAIMVSIKKHHEDIAHFLLENGADIHLYNEDGWSCLNLAILYRLKKVFVDIINLGPNVNHCTNKGISPLISACKNGQPNFVDILINLGAHVDHSDDAGNTALCHAIRYHHFGLLKRLLEGGSDANCTNYKGDTPLTLLCSQTDSKDQKLEGVLEAFQLLVAYGGDVSHLTNTQKTPLILAARYGHNEIVTRLIFMGVDLLVEDKFSYNAKHYASVYGHSEISTILDTFSKLPHLPPDSISQLVDDVIDIEYDVATVLKFFLDYAPETLVFYDMDQSSQAIAHVIESVCGHENRDARLIEFLWNRFKEDFGNHTPNLITSKVNNRHTLEYMLENRICRHLVKEWAEFQDNMNNIILLLKGDYSESHNLGLRTAFHSTHSFFPGRKSKRDSLKEEGSKIGSLNFLGMFSRSKEIEEDEKEEEKGEEETFQEGGSNFELVEDEAKQETRVGHSPSVFNYYDIQSFDEKELDDGSEKEDHSYDKIEKMDGIDSSLYYMFQLVLGVRNDEDISHWSKQFKNADDEVDVGSVKKQIAIKDEDWPFIFLNLFINSPRSHEILSKFLKLGGLKHWDGKEARNLYRNLVYLDQGETSWSGLFHALPTKPSFGQNLRPEFCYAWEVNPKIGTAALMDRRVLQAISRSPSMEILMDVPLIHFLMEMKWREYGLRVTRILLFLYMIFLGGSTNVLIWASKGDINHPLFYFNIFICTLCIIIQTVIEGLQVFSIQKEEDSLEDKIKLIINEYVFDIWNFLDCAIIITWLSGLAMLLNPERNVFSKDVYCALAALLFWSKILYFGRGVKAYSMLIEVLTVIISDMIYFCLLLFMFLGAFAVAFRCLGLDSSFNLSMLRVFNMIFGEFDIGDFSNLTNGSDFSVLLFVIFMIFVSLVLLNALIALMGDSFDKAQEQARIGYLSSRCQLLAEYEQMGFDHGSRYIFHKCNQMYHYLEENLSVEFRLRNFMMIIVEKVKERPMNQKYIPILGCIFYLFFLIFIWIECAFLFKILMRFVGREMQTGKFMIFVSEKSPTSIDNPGDGGWYGKLPRIMGRIEDLEDVMERYIAQHKHEDKKRGMVEEEKEKSDHTLQDQMKALNIQLSQMEASIDDLSQKKEFEAKEAVEREEKESDKFMNIQRSLATNLSESNKTFTQLQSDQNQFMKEMREEMIERSDNQFQAQQESLSSLLQESVQKTVQNQVEAQFSNFQTMLEGSIQTLNSAQESQMNEIKSELSQSIAQAFTNLTTQFDHQLEELRSQNPLIQQEEQQQQEDAQVDQEEEEEDKEE